MLPLNDHFLPPNNEAEDLTNCIWWDSDFKWGASTKTKSNIKQNLWWADGHIKRIIQKIDVFKKHAEKGRNRESDLAEKKNRSPRYDPQKLIRAKLEVLCS